MVLAIVMMAAGGASAGRRITVTRASIAAIGATRLSDLFVFANAWSPATHDGYTVSPTPRALSLPRDTQWTILLNGQTVDVSTLDAMTLDAVPVTLAEIDSVVFRDAPTPGVAWDSSRGRVEIFATRVTSGWRSGGATSAATWLGDVGPVRFASGSARGSDTVGPDASLWIARGAGRWYAGLSASVEQHPFVDPSMQRESASLRAGLRAAGAWHDVLLSATESPDYVHYSEPFGRGVGADQRSLVAGVSGGLERDSGLIARYRVSATENRLARADDDSIFANPWRWRRARAGADLERRGRRSRAGVFAGLEHREVTTADSLSRRDDTFVRAGAFLQRRAGRAWTFDADAAGTLSDGDGAASLGAGAAWVVRPADTLRVRVQVSQRLFAEDDNLELWSARGADFLDRGGVAYTIDGAVDRTTVSAADIGWTSCGVLGGVEVDLGLRRYDDAYVATHAFSLNPATGTFESPSAVVTGQSGHVAIVRSRLWHALGDHSWADFSWVYHEALDCDPALGTLWQTLPRHRLTYAIYAQPARAWRFHLRITHFSSTLWTDYAGADGATYDSGDGVFTVRSRVNGATFLDAGFRVAAWRRRATLDVGARNLFDADVRYHPAGASQALTLYGQLALRWDAP